MSTVTRAEDNSLLCCGCKKYTNKLHNGYCTACNREASRRSVARRKERINKQYEDWVASIKGKEYHPLTEDEWLDACRHFKKCAYCNTREINTRSMFIDFKDGGRYAAWNIVPSCEECALASKVLRNPFARMNRMYSNNQADCAAIKYNLSVSNLNKITDYLSSKM